MDVRYFLQLRDKNGRVVCNWSQPYETWSLRDIKAHCRAQLDCSAFRLARIGHGTLCSALPNPSYRSYTFRVDGARYYIDLFEAPNGDGHGHAFGALAPESTDDEIEAYGERLAMYAPWLYQD